MKKVVSTLIFSLLLCFSAATVFAQEEMTNDEVISLTRAGLAGSIIIGKIRTTKTNFDMSTDALIKLKQAGVGDDVVGAMLETKSSKSTGGTTTSGAASVTAALQINSTDPVFYFYLDTSSGGMNTSSGIPSTPNEFTLVRFNQRSDNREVTIAKSNSWGGKGGLSDEYVVGLKSEDLGNGTFRITATAPLKKGEYGFMLLNSGNANSGAGVGSKFFDFGVQMTP
ncbi:MAG: hypothetical protein IPK01_11450 [Acidobacteria bacterium]|nr:hypothetical protein [Acidobacteriota bacterium]